MPTDRFAKYVAISSGVIVAAALIIPAVYRGSHHHQPAIEHKVDNFFAKYDLNKDGVVDKREYNTVTSQYFLRIVP